MTSTERQADRPQLGLAVRRALVGRCPNCGDGKLFASYLKQVERCAVCEEQYGHVRSDDAAPWLTILIVGHLIVPAALAVESRASLPGWVSMTLWPALALLATLIILPRSKALFLGLIWCSRSVGSERD